MGYRAYHDVSRSIRKGEEDAKYDALIMEGCNYAMVHNSYHLCSAYSPDDIKEPMDVVQAFVADKSAFSERGGDFMLDDDEIAELAADVRAKFPDHADTPAVLAELEQIRKRDGEQGGYEFICF